MEPSRGRRSNGLSSADWGALVDLDPRLSEALLSRLEAAGVAAYVEPALDADTFTRAARQPNRPLDRLWVDPERADVARQVVGSEVADLTALLAEQEPGATAHGLVQPVPRTAARRVLSPPPLPTRPQPQSGPQSEPQQDDADEEFRRIVEGFDREGDSPVAPWPVAEDVEPPPARRVFPTRPERDPSTPARRRTDPQPEDDLPGWVEPDPLEDDGHYVPPPPPPLPHVAPQKVLAVLAVVAGVLLMFAPKLLLQDRTDFVLFSGMLLTVGGAAALIWLMRDTPPTDSGPDDGAVV